MRIVPSKMTNYNLVPKLASSLCNRCTVSCQAQLISAIIGLKVLASKAIGAFMKMKKEVKFSSFGNHQCTTFIGITR